MHDVAGGAPDGQDGLPPRSRAGRPAVDAGRVPERPGDRLGEAIEDVGPVVVVHGKDPAGAQVGPHRLHGLQGEQVALEAQRGLAADERQRVGQGEDDEVVATVAALEKGASVVDVHAHARVLVGAIGVVAGADRLDHRVDLDGVDVPGALRESDGDVVAVARADDQDVAQGPALEVPVGIEVEGVVATQQTHRVDRLVRQAVDLDRLYPVGRTRDAHLVVGRPVLVRHERDRAESDHDGQQRHDLPAPEAGAGPSETRPSSAGPPARLRPASGS